MRDRVVDFLIALGWRTYGREAEDPLAIVRRPRFNYEPVKRLYWIEIPALFARLQLDDGATLKRDDPALFEKELDHLLEDYGPKIWPRMGKGDRSHLREPAPDSLYPKDLVYPRDAAEIKTIIKKIILIKKVRPSVDLQALVGKHGKKRTRHTAKSAPTAPVAEEPQRKERPRKRTRVTIGTVNLSETASNSSEASEPDSDTDGEAAESNTSPVTKNAVDPETEASADTSINKSGISGIILRLYSRGTDPTSYGDITPDEITNPDELFAVICEQMECDCSWVKIVLPEDMSGTKIRIQRGQRSAEAAFENLIECIQSTVPFVGLPGRLLEVECGLDRW